MTSLTRQALRFGIVGLANTTVGLLIIYGVLYFLNTGPAVANAIGYAIGVAISFVLNRLWTFSDSRSIDNVLPRYLLTVAISYLLNLSIVLLVTHHFGMGPYLVQLFGMGVYTTVMFFGCRWFVFRTQKHSSILLKR